MRILHVVPSYLPASRYGGPIVSVHALCRSLAAQGYEVHVFTTSVDGPADSPVPLGVPVEMDGVKVWYFPVPFLRRLYYAPDMRLELRKQASTFDVIHTHSVFLWPTWAAARAARAASVPYVLAPRGMLVRELVQRRSSLAKTAWIALIEKTNIERATAIHITSQEEGRSLKDFGFLLPPVREVPNGIDAVEIAAQGSALPDAVARVLDGDRPVVLYLGRINWKKGIERLIRAAPLVPEAVLLLIGNDEENCLPDLLKIANEAGVRDRVVVGGPVYGPARYEIYRKAAVFVLPSRSENFGNVILEAIACGCPVVTTRATGAAAVVEEVGGGMVVEDGDDTAALGAAIHRLLGQPRSKCENAARKIRATYSWESIAKRMLEVYREVV